MKIIRVTSTAGAFLLFATMVPAFGQRDGGEKQSDQRPEQHAHQPQQHAQQPQGQQHAAQAQQPREQQSQSRPQEAPKTQPARQRGQRGQQTVPQQQVQQHQQQSPRIEQTQQTRQQPQPVRTQQQARSWQQQRGWAQPGGGSPGHATFAQDRSRNWSSDHRTWAQRGGYGGYYVPQDRFSVSFGSQHFFRLGVLPVMYLGYPQFSHGGFSFLMVDPWPEDWSANWYASDDVYIDYDDGYYLYNRRFPQERLAVTIML